MVEVICYEFIPDFYKRNILLTSLAIVLRSLADKPKYQKWQFQGQAPPWLVAIRLDLYT